MRISLLSVTLVASSLLMARAPAGAAGEAPPPVAPAVTNPGLLPQPDPDEVKQEEKKREAREAAFEERKAGFAKLADTAAKMADERKKAFEPGSMSITIDDETKTVTEPNSIESALDYAPGRKVRDEYEISPADFSLYSHERWGINLSDFKLDAPVYVTGDLTAGIEKTWFGFTFTVTNTTAQKRRISPMFMAFTNKGVCNVAVGGFVPERILADSLDRPLGTPPDMKPPFHDKELLDQGVAPLEPQINLGAYAFDPEKRAATLSPMSTFEPGQTRWGAALWPKFTNDFVELKIVVHGLTNAHRYEERMRKVLLVTLERKDDEFNVYRTPLRLKDKKWVYTWMWDQDLSVPIPADAKDPQIKVQALKTPAGGMKLAWAFPFVLKNSTRASQEIAFNRVAYVCPVDVTIGGVKVPVEARINDDGRSTIYKAQVLKALGKESPRDRFEPKGASIGSKTTAERRKMTLEAGKSADEIWAVFEESDVDWSDIVVQVEAALTAKIDKQALAKQTWAQAAKTAAPGNAKAAAEISGVLYDPRRRLTDDEVKQVKDQVAKALPAALDAAKAKKTVVAYFDCVSGLSTGDYRVSRGYRQPGVVDESWLKAWEELGK